nr:putative fatty acyl-CoA reductase CG5065 [Onthophagus taurus]
MNQEEPYYSGARASCHKNEVYVSGREKYCSHRNSLKLSQWYDGKKIFITGATGSMGKVLVEKLLRSTNVKIIYILIRSKRGQSVEERLKKYFSIPLFDLLKSKSPKSLDKLRFISGDLKKANLGINEDELIVLLKDVDVVFHMAANVKFQEPLKETVLTNLGGSYNVLELAKRFKNLSVYIHVSTSYCHVNEEILEEKMYPAPHNPRKMLDLVQWINENTLNKITPDIINGYPNTYAYTKSLTEELVGEYSSFMKIAILRPSIVTASLSEPFPGWVDNLNGPTGLMIGCGKGIIRSMLCNAQSVADLVPVDITINRMIVIAKELSNIELLKEPLIINLTGDADNSITWGETLEFSKKHVLNNPFSIMLWYPNATLRTCRFCHVLIVYLFHLVPAYFIDFLFRIIPL